MTVQEPESADRPQEGRVWLSAFIPPAANPVLTSLPTSGSLCLSITCSLSRSPCFRQSFQSLISFRRFIFFFPSDKKSEYCQTFYRRLGAVRGAAGCISNLQLGAGHPKLPADARAKLALARCCISFLEGADIALLCRCLAQISAIPVGARARAGKRLETAFHVKALLPFRFQLVTDKYLLLPPPKGTDF